MALAQAAVDKAASMGRDAGQTFAQAGSPTRNPFPSSQPVLAQAWRRGYLETIGKARKS